MDINDWLTMHGMESYIDLFLQEKIDLDILGTLTELELRSLGIPLGDCKRLLSAYATEMVGATLIDRESRTVQQRMLTVVFCDQVGSVELLNTIGAERMRQSNQMYRQLCRKAFENFGGVIYQYQGDGAVAYFGYPIALEKSAERAIRASLELLASLSEAAVDAGETLFKLPSVRIGIASGPVIIGLDEDEDVSLENAVGQTPNLAARLQHLAPENKIVISQQTQQLVGNSFALSGRKQELIKGFSEPHGYYQVTGLVGDSASLEPASLIAETPMVGRSAEIDRLQACWQSAVTGQGSAVVVTGEPGIGKSRVISEFMCSVIDDPSMQFLFYGSSFHQNTPYFPIFEQLARGFNFSVDDEEPQKLKKMEQQLKALNLELDQVLPYLSRLLNISVKDGFDAEIENSSVLKTRTFAAMIEVVKACSVKYPLIISVEDLHWFDPTSMELVQKFRETVKSLPVLLIISARNDFDWTWREECREEIRLGPLDSADSLDLARRVAIGKGLKEKTLHEIVEKTDGNPLFLEETTRTVLGSIANTVDSASGLAGEPMGVPASLHDSLMLRLDRLGTAKETAQLASVVGRSFSEKLVRHISMNGDRKVQSDLAVLVANGVINFRDGPKGREFSFKHSLVRDIAYNSLLLSARTNFHGIVARSLTEHFPDIVEFQPEVVAQHYTVAGSTVNAANYWLQAGILSTRRWANKEAVLHLQNGLSEIEAGNDSSTSIIELRLKLLARLVAPLFAIQGFGSEQMESATQQAMSLCTRFNQSAIAFSPFLYGSWIARQAVGKHKEALDLAKDFLRLAQNDGEIVAVTYAHRAIAWSEFNLGRPRLAEEHFKLSENLFDKKNYGDLPIQYGIEPRIGYGCGRVQSLWCLGYPDQALRIAEDTLLFAEESSDSLSILLAGQYAGCLLNSLCRDWKSVKSHADRLLLVGEERQFPQATFVGKYYGALANTMISEKPAQITAALETIKLTRSYGYAYMMPFWYTQLASACLVCGQFEQAAACLDEAQNIITETHEAWHLPEIYRLQGRLSENMHTPGATIKARQWYQKSAAVAMEQNAKSWELRAWTDLFRIGDAKTRPVAERQLDELVQWFAEGHQLEDLGNARSSLELV